MKQGRPRARTRIDKVVTRGGDAGRTSLADGKRISKASARVMAIGEVDELNCWIGLVCTRVSSQGIRQLLERIQHELFVLGADLATPLRAGKHEIRRISAQELAGLDAAIEQYNRALPPLEEFVLPGGSEAGALLHLGRAVARRAERAVVSLAKSEKVTPQVIPYLNRLSDLLFVLARVINRDQFLPETSAQFH